MSSFDTINIDGLEVGPSMVRGYRERIAELEHENARLRSESRLTFSLQLAADKKQAYAEGIKEGMERSAEIAYELGWGSVATAIRKEIEK